MISVASRASPDGSIVAPGVVSTRSAVTIENAHVGGHGVRETRRLLRVVAQAFLREGERREASGDEEARAAAASGAHRSGDVYHVRERSGR